MKYLGLNVTEYVQDLYTLIMERKTDLKKLNVKINHVCELENNIIRMLLLPKLIYRFTTIPIKNSAGNS